MAPKALFQLNSVRPFARHLALAILALGPGACSSKPSPRTAPPVIEGGLEEAPPPPAEIGAENLPPSEETGAPPAPSLKDVQVAVYIDAIGFDAIAALGFMQELEKAGVKPVKVVGTGFGCWVALSWALEGSGNRAEWQTFKWTRWDLLPQRGLLNRLKGALGGDERFFAEVTRHFKGGRVGELRLPADCPLVANESSFPMESSRSLEIKQALWWQMLHPAIGTPESALEDEKHLSGIFLGFPAEEEWDALSSQGSGGQPTLWLHLKTRRAAERRLRVENAVLLGLRGEPPAVPIKRTARGDYWMQIDLSAAGGRRTPENLRDAGWRRRFLLDGRKRGRQILESKQIETRFGELFAVPPGG